MDLVINQTYFVMKYDLTKHLPREISTELPLSGEYLGGGRRSGARRADYVN